MFDRRGGGPGPIWRGAAALDAGVHVRLVVVAEVENVVVALGGAGERLQADVVRAAVAGPAADGGFAFAQRVHGRLDARGRGCRGFESHVQQRHFQAGIRERTVDHRPAAGGEGEYRIPAQGLQSGTHGDAVAPQPWQARWPGLISSSSGNVGFIVSPPPSTVPGRVFSSCPPGPRCRRWFPGKCHARPNRR